MRLYCFVDIKSKNFPAVEGCLLQLKEQFKDVIPVTWIIEYKDFSNLSWESYDPDSKGVSFAQVSKDTKAVWDKYEYLYDSVTYFIDESNWKANELKKPEEPQIRGWNLGQFFNNYQVQLLATADVLAHMNYRINEEVAHSIDDFAFRELGKNLDAELGLDYDTNVVHAEPFIGWETRTDL